MRDERETSQRETERDGMSNASQFSLMSFREAQHMVVRACGRLVLGHGAHERLWALHLEQTAATDVALDLSCVNDVDARGIGVLATLARRARQRGTTVSVIAASSVVQRLVEVTRLDRAIPGAWNKRIGLLSCGAARRALARVHSVARDSSYRVGDKRSAAP